MMMVELNSITEQSDDDSEYDQAMTNYLEGKKYKVASLAMLLIT
jgi:hypothetical protein